MCHHPKKEADRVEGCGEAASRQRGKIQIELIEASETSVLDRTT
jgi:hypothetical protein